MTPDDTRLKRTPIVPRRSVMPLDLFPLWKQAEIRAAIDSPTPPPKYMEFGPGDRPVARTDQVLERDGLICGICTEPVERSDVHLDHIVPFSQGGPDTVANLRVTHSRCNLRRGAPK